MTKRAAGMVLVGACGIATAASGAFQFAEPFRPDFRHIVRVSCPTAVALPRTLLDAAACGDAFRLRARLAEGDDVDATDRRPGLAGRTPLHHAAQRGELDAVQRLLAAGARPDAADAEGNTALHLLTVRDRGGAELEIASALLKAGADARLRNSKGQTALEALMMHGRNGLDPLRISPVPLAALLDEAEAAGLQPSIARVKPVDVGDAAAPETMDAMSAPPAASVRAALDAWAHAWSTRDVDGYLGHYAPAFRPADGRSFAAWAAQRRARVGGAGAIALELSDVTISLDDDRATAEFTQDYRSENYRSTDRKRIVMIHDGENWRIVQEMAVH